MNIGKRIKERRKELGLSVDDVASKLNKNRATVYRYESNDIENLPLNILEPLAKVLNTTPAYLMGWKKENPTNIDINSRNTLSNEETTLLENFNKLNDLGKKEANKRVAELTEINKYIDDDTTNELCSTLNSSQNYIIKMPKESKRERLQDYFTTIAAHNDDLTEEEKIIAEQKVLEALRKAKLI